MKPCTTSAPTRAPATCDNGSQPGNTVTTTAHAEPPPGVGDQPPTFDLASVCELTWRATVDGEPVDAPVGPGTVVALVTLGGRPYERAEELVGPDAAAELLHQQIVEDSKVAFERFRVDPCARAPGARDLLEPGPDADHAFGSASGVLFRREGVYFSHSPLEEGADLLHSRAAPPGILRGLAPPAGALPGVLPDMRLRVVGVGLHDRVMTVAEAADLGMPSGAPRAEAVHGDVDAGLRIHELRIAGPCVAEVG